MPSTPPPASPASEAPKPKKKICCACPDTKRPRDEVRACARVRAARTRAACSTQARAHESLAFNAVRNLPHAPRARAASAHGMRCWCGVGSAWRGLLPQRPRSAEARQSPAVRLCPCPCPCAASDGRTCRLPPTHPPSAQCIALKGEEACKDLIEAHKKCLRAEGFDVRAGAHGGIRRLGACPPEGLHA